MAALRDHTEFRQLIDISGPFLSIPVLRRVFPQGFPKEEDAADRLHRTRTAWEEWQQDPALYALWLRFVLTDVLEYPDALLAEGQAIPQTLRAEIPEHHETLRPNLVLFSQAEEDLLGNAEPGTGQPILLIQTYSSSQDLNRPTSDRSWKASPATRMSALLQGTGMRLGLVTNGSQWLLADAPRNETASYATWTAEIWFEEEITFRSFRALLGARRFYSAAPSDQLAAMLDESAKNQQEVTDQLGRQVRRAVEMLIQALDRADQDRQRGLLAGIPENQLYEAAVTVMMRLVFLFSAEERGLLLLGEAIYDQNYAVSTLHTQLRDSADRHTEEVLERRRDAWNRLLSTFRAVFAGIPHDRIGLPAYGGGLFDPDRYPFLEGRVAGTSWRDTPAAPLPVHNRTVLHLLEALQFLEMRVPGGTEQRRLTFRELDIEQIGHVYESLPVSGELSANRLGRGGGGKSRCSRHHTGGQSVRRTTGGRTDSERRRSTRSVCTPHHSAALPFRR